jgi:hypothetical protein
LQGTSRHNGSERPRLPANAIDVTQRALGTVTPIVGHVPLRNAGSFLIGFLAASTPIMTYVA